MPMQDWTRLVQQVDQLIAELRAARAETTRWRARAAELEGLQLRQNRDSTLSEQAKDRDLERYRRERKKTVASIEKMLTELEIVQQQVQAQESTEGGG